MFQNDFFSTKDTLLEVRGKDALSYTLIQQILKTVISEGIVLLWYDLVVRTDQGLHKPYAMVLRVSNFIFV
jgi:hypothetical protein